MTPALSVTSLDSRSSGEDIESPNSLLSNLKTFGVIEDTRRLMDSTEAIDIDLKEQTENSSNERSHQQYLSPSVSTADFSAYEPHPIEELPDEDIQILERRKEGRKSPLRNLINWKKCTDFLHDFWRKYKWYLFALFWLIFVIVLIYIIVVATTTPKISSDSQEYWQRSPIYHLLPSTFNKSANGTFGFQAITENLDHFVYLGVEVILLSSIFNSSSLSQEAFNVTDFKSVHPELGSMEDFKDLMEAATKKNLRIVLDVVPTHTSQYHEWFYESLEASSPYADFYVWRDCTEEDSFSNLTSTVGDSAWTWNIYRRQCYLSQIAGIIPAVNLNNPQVRQAFKDIFQVWLDRGVAGFNIRGLDYFEASSYDVSTTESSTEAADVAIRSVFLGEIRQLLDAKKLPDGQRRILLTDVDQPISQVIPYYGSSGDKLADIVLNNHFMEELEALTATKLNAAIKQVINDIPQWAWPSWILSNNNNSRLDTRLATKLAESLAMVQMTLPGTPIIYYGEEVGLQDTTNATYENATNLFYEPACGWMDWEAVETQKNSSRSRLNMYKKLVNLRQETAILQGKTELIDSENNIFAFTRIHQDKAGYLVVINVANNPQVVSFENQTRLPDELTVEVFTAGSSQVSVSIMSKTNVSLDSYGGLVLSFLPKNE